LGLSGGWLAVPAAESQQFEVDSGALLPNVSLASPALIEITCASDVPLLLAPPEDLAAYVSMPTVSAETPGARPWYLAGARVLVPLRTGRGELLGLWVLGAPTSGDLLERADLGAFARLAALAEMQLERRRARNGTSVARESVSGGEVLTQREQEVFALLARGCSNREIADELVISVRTAETHVEHILRKLSLDNRTQAILLAREDVAPQAG
jgi:DNA-binding CsgD family transcriptional regulator